MAESNPPRTLLLMKRMQDGDPRAADELFSLVHAQLRQIAGRLMRSERRDHTLQPTDLVHEAYVQLAQREDAGWAGRAHFLAIAARAMKHLLVDHARRRRRQKRGGERRQVTLRDEVASQPLDVDLLDLHGALVELEELDERQALITEMRYFGGMTVPEIAKHLGVSVSTVERDWLVAKTWLKARLGAG